MAKTSFLFVEVRKSSAKWSIEVLDIKRNMDAKCKG